MAEDHGAALLRVLKAQGWEIYSDERGQAVGYAEALIADLASERAARETAEAERDELRAEAGWRTEKARRIYAGKSMVQFQRGATALVELVEGRKGSR